VPSNCWSHWQPRRARAGLACRAATACQPECGILRTAVRVVSFGLPVHWHVHGARVCVRARVCVGGRRTRRPGGVGFVLPSRPNLESRSTAQTRRLLSGSSDRRPCRHWHGPHWHGPASTSAQISASWQVETRLGVGYPKCRQCNWISSWSSPPDPVRVSDGGRGPRECPMSGGEEKAERPVSTRNLGGQVTWSAQCSHCARMPLATGSTPRWGRMFCKVRRKDRALSMELVKLDSELAHSS
jgi:hypothetical protein